MFNKLMLQHEKEISCLNQEIDQLLIPPFNHDFSCHAVDTLTVDCEKDSYYSFYNSNSTFDGSFLERKRELKDHKDTNGSSSYLIDDCHFWERDLQYCKPAPRNRLSSLQDSTSGFNEEYDVASQGIYQANSNFTENDVLNSLGKALIENLDENEEEKMLNSWKHSFSNDFSNDLSSEIIISGQELSKNQKLVKVSSNYLTKNSVATTIHNLSESDQLGAFSVSTKRDNSSSGLQDHHHRKKGTGEKKKNCCSCKKSSCLKLYCECFKKGNMCYSCTCPNCYNCQDYIELREKSIINLKAKNQHAFRSTPNENGKSDNISKGCKCKNSNCQKNYCECYQNGIGCSELCKCQNCYNGDKRIKHA